MNPPISPPPKQTGLFQYAQMFRDGGERHGVRLRQVRHTFITAREMSQDTPPGGIGQRSKSTIQCSRRIFNHLVKQCSRPFPMQIKKQPSLQQGYGWDGLRDRFIKRMVPTKHSKETKGVPISEIFASFRVLLGKLSNSAEKRSASTVQTLRRPSRWLHKLSPCSELSVRSV